MKIAIGSDHGGYALKMQLIPVKSLAILFKILAAMMKPAWIIRILRFR